MVVVDLAEEAPVVEAVVELGEAHHHHHRRWALVGCPFQRGILTLILILTHLLRIVVLLWEEFLHPLLHRLHQGLVVLTQLAIHPLVAVEVSMGNLGNQRVLGEAEVGKDLAGLGMVPAITLLLKGLVNSPWAVVVVVVV